MEEKNNNKGLIILVCILSVLVLALGGFIVYDKVLSEKEPTICDNINIINNCTKKDGTCKKADKEILGTYYLNEENGDNSIYFNLKEDGTADVVESSCGEGPLPVKNVKYRITEIDNAVILEIDYNEDGKYVEKYVGRKDLNRFYETTIGCVGSEKSYYEKR